MPANDRNGWQANLPPRWLNDATYRSLSPSAWALFTWTLVWGVNQENDGNVTTRDLPFIAAPMLSRTESDEAAAELVEAGLWDVTDEGFVVAEWSRSQVTAGEINDKRATWRQKKRGARPVTPPQPPEGNKPSSTEEAGPVPARNGTFQVGKEGQEGKARTGTTGTPRQATNAPRFEPTDADPTDESPSAAFEVVTEPSGAVKKRRRVA